MKTMFILAFLLTIGVSPCFGQSGSDTRDALALEDCIQTALKNRIELRIAAKDIQNSKEQIKEAKSLYYPRLNLSAGYTHFNEPVTIDVDINISKVAGPFNLAIPQVVQFGIVLDPIPNALHQEFTLGETEWAALSLNLIQPLYTFGRIKEAVKQARIGHSIAESQRDKKRIEIVTEVKKAYYQHRFLKEVARLLSEAELKAGVTARMVKIAYETSVPDKDDKGTTRVDYLQARNFHSEIKSKLIDADKALESAEIALKYVVGVNIDQPLRLQDIPLDSMPIAPIESKGMKEAALERNADLKTLNLGIKFYDSRQRLAKKEYLPKIGIQGQYVGPEDRFGVKNSWFVGIGLNMTLFDGFSTKAKVAQSQIQLEKIKDQGILLEKAISAQISALHKTLSGLTEKMEVLRGAIEETNERVNLAAEGYSAGLIEYEKLLSAQKTEIEMKLARLQCLVFYHTMKSEIELLSGAM